MVSLRGQSSVGPLTFASDHGGIHVEEYGYGLGPPTGILLLRYPPGPVVPDFPEGRDDHLHQILWCPDGTLAVRRGLTTEHLGPQQALWVRRGTVFEAAALGHHTVIRVCLRQATPELTAVSAGSVVVPASLGAGLLDLTRPGHSEEEGRAFRTELLSALSTTPPAELRFERDTDSHVQTVARALLRDPADPRGLSDWAGLLHVSTKTLQRDFQRAYATSFTQWRTDVRLRASLSLLDTMSVTETAHRVGYSSASAFVAAFTRTYGETPGALTRR